ncbi:MAG: protein translocase subunit SecD [Magnetococcales bacterium]|nr:protein translocase subunit SecD [Magnetococcales bacterium]
MSLRWRFILVMVVILVSIQGSLPTFMGGVPSWWPSWLSHVKVNQGLDLQGGLYLLLEVEVEKAVEQTAENLVDDLRAQLKQEKLRFRGVERTGRDRVLLKPAEEGDTAALRKMFKERFSNHEVIEETDKSGFTVRLSDQEQNEIRRMAVEQSIQTIRSRVDQFGVAEPIIQKQGTNRVLVQLPGLKDVERAKALIGRTARLEFKMVDRKGDLEKALAGRIPPGDEVLYGEERSVSGKMVKQPYLLKKRTVLTGDRLTDARVNFSSQTNEPYVGINFDRVGGRKFAELTSENVGELMAIVLDNKVYSAPVIREKIEGGRAQISGSFTLEEANDLAIALRSGALPAPVNVLEERTVGPSLGSDSIHQGLLSMALGSGLVVLFMVVYYKGFGIIASLAVMLNIVILVAGLAWLGATLTLPGIAGVVLLVGMAVDANVLINERIREEVRLGKSPLAAIDHGYEKAFVTILDSNLTTVITSVILYQFGTGPVRGFAVTLTLGLLVSMFTAIFVTRVAVNMALRNRRVTRLSI